MMKRLLIFTSIGMLLIAAGGCRIGECWREAWNSRFHPQPQQTVIVADPCVVTDPCCNPCTTPVITPGPTTAR